MKSSVNIGYVVFLSVVAALGGFLFGYDTAVISGTIAKVTAQFNLDTMSQGCAAAQVGRDDRPEPDRQVIAVEPRDLYQGL